MSLLESIWKSILLGTVQGLTEFLPVSSSGHLSLLQRMLGFRLEGGSMTFLNVMLHFGTLVAVVFAFRKDLVALFKKPYKTLGMLVVATIPAGVVGLLCADGIDSLFAGERGLAYLTVCFSVTALALLATEFFAKRRKVHVPLGWKHALPMGLTQAIALFPGISRSGSTIAAGTLSGAKAEDVARFSFLMSVPVILGSFVLELKDVIFPAEGAVPIGTNEVVGTVIGVLFAALSGFFAIRLMLKVVSKANYKWFSLYLVLLSLFCFWLDVLAIF
ncbi:MAG: undecaprenyl-diphosphate phosphatase [Candidatus Gallimonas sp.]